jgi:DHA1 family multidrug resistance protein-like MFS transporter
MSLARAIKNKLDEYFVRVFRDYPVLVPVAAVAIFGQISAASVNNFALSFYVLDDLHQPGRVLGYLTSSFLLTETLLKLPFGRLSDQWGRRPLIVLGLVAMLALPVVVAFVPAAAFVAVPALIYLLLLPLRLVGGAGSAAVWPPIFAIVPDEVPKRHRGAGMAVLNSTYSLGIAIGPALGGLVGALALKIGASHWAMRAPFALAAFAGLVAVGAAWLLPKEEPPGRREQKSAVLPPARIIAIISSIAFVELFATSSLAPYLAPYMVQVTGITRSQAGYFLLLLGVPVVLLGLPLGRLTDRWPKYQVRQLALWISAVGMWGVPFLSSIWLIGLLGGLVVVGFLVGLPAWLALIAGLAPEGRRGLMMAFLATAEGIGGFAGPLVSGFLWEHNIRYPFFMSAAALTLAALMAIIFVRPDWAGE